VAGRYGRKDTVYRTGSPWENGYCESFNSKLRDEFLNGEIFYSLKELQVLAERWRGHYNTVRPHSSLGRARAAGLRTKISAHSFRATGITTYLENGDRPADGRP
jgi:transposase InsO family protein